MKPNGASPHKAKRSLARGLRHLFLSTGQSLEKIAADAISFVSFSLGWLLLVLGLLLMLIDAGMFVGSTSVPLVSSRVELILAQFPGIPLYLAELTPSPATIAGLVVWLLGLDILLVGLGLWARHRLARWVAILVFGLAAFFDFVQFLLSGLLGAPGPTIELIVNSLILYGLFKREIWFNS